MKFTSTAISAALLLASPIAAHGSCKAWASSKKLQEHITEKGLMDNLRQLDTIATNNGGNRAMGFPGYAASVDFIVSQLKKLSSVKVWTQDFPANFSSIESISLSIDSKPIYVVGLTYSPSTSKEGLTAPLAAGPLGDAGCTVDGYKGYDVKDKIVFVSRGTCPTGGTLAGRIRPAVAAGAAAVILYNNVETNSTAGTLSAPDPVGYRPAGLINLADGAPIRARLEAGETIIATFQQTQTIATKITQNVFAETNGGDPNNVIMLGAHLDSVPAGAGINDDGSGTSLILENVKALDKYRVKNKVRFAWWGAEELGLVGSRFYTSTLPKEDVNKLLLYLNFDMVSRGYFGVFDGDGNAHGLAGPPGSDVIEKLFADWFVEKGLTVTPAVFTGGSDYDSFMKNLWKPVGGLHTGTGVAQDPCYHQKCDHIGNPNATVITINAKAAAHVLGTLAITGHEIIPKNATATSAAKREELFPRDFEWTKVEGERHLACGHDI